MPYRGHKNTLNLMFITDKLQAQIDALKSFRSDMGEIMADILSDREDELLGRQRDQLASGLDSEGEDIIPSYSQDIKPTGYFNTVSAAERYAAWKQNINVPLYDRRFERDPDSPNLFVSGKFHSELAVDVSNSEILFYGGTPYAENIINRYGLDKFGLNEQFWRMVMENGVITELRTKMREYLNLE